MPQVLLHVLQAHYAVTQILNISQKEVDTYDLVVGELLQDFIRLWVKTRLERGSRDEHLIEMSLRSVLLGQLDGLAGCTPRKVSVVFFDGLTFQVSRMEVVQLIDGENQIEGRLFAPELLLGQSNRTYGKELPVALDVVANEGEPNHLVRLRKDLGQQFFVQAFHDYFD